MRGIQKSKPKKHICSGFIPTHAGNIRPTAGTWCLLRVHPRPRGEYFYISAFYTSTKGSSPLARGILKQARTDSDMARFTPAYAGNTGAGGSGGLPQWVHPRLRGEYPIGDFTVSLPLGSPPLTRGIYLAKAEGRDADRFTPAYAGNTHNIIDYTVSEKVHPRLRGEYCCIPSTRLDCIGSSPLTRGIH